MKRRLVLLMTCLFCSIGLALAQNKRISGTVVDSNGDPVTGATVVVKGTTVGVSTDVDGKYSISVPQNGKTLVISLIGSKSKEVAVGNNLKIVLENDNKSLDEVVVIAYGTQSTRKLASSVSSVKGDAIKDAANVSFDQAIQGRATGVQVTSPAGVVGQPPIVRIRGVNSITSGTSPLYVVDGVPLLSGNLGLIGQANGLADINPNDILSMEVLKDAAATAMYGSRGANGVILITTKNGSRNKVKVTYDGWFGYSAPTHFMKVMDAQQYVDYKNVAVKNRFGTDAYDIANNKVLTDGRKAFNMMYDANKNAINSKWKDAIFQNGFTQNHSVSVNGGNDQSQYFISGNYMDQSGMVIGDKYSRLGVKANVNVTPTTYLKIGASLNATTSKNSAVDAARDGSNFAVGGFPRMGLINAPNIPIHNEDGTPYYSPSGGLGYGPNTVYNTYSNPTQLVAEGNFSATDVDRLVANFYGELKPIKGLTLRTQYGIDYANMEDRLFWSPLHGDGYSDGGYAANTASHNKQWVWTNTANYNFVLNKNTFDVLLGMEANQTDYKAWGVEKLELTDVKFVDEQASFLTDNAINDGITSNSLLSYFGRINYDYDNKYIASINFRRDGYSGLGQKWGNFGGLALAWRISQEKFMESLKPVFDEVKLKGSWGLVGNTDVGSYPSKSYYSSYYYGSRSVYKLGQLGDSNLKWETSEKFDLGLSFSLFNKINVEADYYHTNTKDLILDVPQSPSKGIPGSEGANGSIKTNVGKMQNSGIEFSIDADVIKTKDFTWNTGFNLTTNKNKVTELADGVTEILGGDYSGLETTNITVVGKSIGQLYLYPTNGIDRETGRRIFITPEGKESLYQYDGSRGWYYRDGTKYSSSSGAFEQVVAGNTLPTYYGGWTNNFKYKRFDMTLFFQYSGGNKIYNGTRATTADNRFWNNSIDLLDNYWTSDRKDAKYAYPVYGDNYSNGSAMAFTDWVEKGDYVRLKNLVVGYTLDPKLSKFAGISNLRIYLQAQNLFVITKYKGLDPEALTNVRNYNLAGGTDKNTMPQARVLTAGINITF